MQVRRESWLQRVGLPGSKELTSRSSYQCQAVSLHIVSQGTGSQKCVAILVVAVIYFYVCTYVLKRIRLLVPVFGVAEDPEDGTQEQLLAGEIDQLLSSVSLLALLTAVVHPRGLFRRLSCLVSLSHRSCAPVHSAPFHTSTLPFLLRGGLWLARSCLLLLSRPRGRVCVE